MKRIIFIILLFLFLFSTVSADENYSFELYSMSGKLVSTEEIMRKPGVKYLIVDFFSLICEPCKRSLPEWEKFYKGNKSKGFEFLLVMLPATGDRRKQEKALKDYFKKNSFSLESVFDKYSVVGKKFGVVEKSGDVTLPMIFVLNKSGKLLFKAGSHEEAVAKIKNLK